MKSMKVALAVLGVSVLLTVVPAIASDALDVNPGGGGDGGGTPTYTFDYASNNTSWGTATAVTVGPSGGPLANGLSLVAGTVVQVSGTATGGIFGSITYNGVGCGTVSTIDAHTLQFTLQGGDCDVSVNFESGIAPTAGPVSVTVVENSTANPIGLDLGGGAADEVDVASGPSHGTASASGTSITYTPIGGYTGLDSFTYRAKNLSGTSSSATVSITVNPPKPVAADSSASVAENSVGNSITLSLSGGPATSVAIGTGATHGSITVAGTSISYTPGTDYFGPDSFTYTASNDGGSSATATVSITVTPPAPIAGDSNLTVDENSGATSVTLNLSGGPAANLATVESPSHGTVSVSGATMTYTPAHDYTGSDEFTFVASNTGGSSVDVGHVDVTVDPVYGSLTYEYSDSDGQTTSIDGTALATLTATNDTTSEAIASGDSVLDGDGVTVTFTPADGYRVESQLARNCEGDVSFSSTGLSITDFAGPCSIEDTVVAQSAPTAADATATVSANSSANSIPLMLGGPAATGLAVGTAPAHGTVSLSRHSAVYTPDAGYSGADSFTYTASNSGGTSAAATVTVNVTPPAVRASTSAVDVGQSVDITGTNFASGESVTIILHSKPITLGTFAADASGNLAATVTIPIGVAAGRHTLLVDGSVSGIISIPITVHVTAVARVLGFTGGLTSGGILTEIFLAVLLAGLGCYLVMVRALRQRREL